MDEPEPEPEPETAGTRRGPINGVLMLLVRGILGGVELFVLLGWILGRVSDGLSWIVEVFMFMLQAPR